MCENCKDKTVKFSSDLNENTPIHYNEWETDSETEQTKKSQRVTKLKHFLEEFPNYIQNFMQHYFRYHHQYVVLRDKKLNLGDGEMWVHFDFSQSYGGKYGKDDTIWEMILL